MPRELVPLLEHAQNLFAAQDTEIALLKEQQLRRVFTRTATGTGSISNSFKLDERFRLVFVRCHFAGGSGTAAFKISVSSAGGSAYNTILQTVAIAGTNADVHQRMDSGIEPSGWTFQKGDSVKVDWINPSPGGMTWGLEVGLALAS